MDTSKKLYSLQELRGLASIIIVFSHIPCMEFLFGSARGGYGVAIFFLLSGFFAMYSTENRGKNFLIKRLYKIVPLYWVITLFTYGIAYFKPEFFNTAKATPVNLIKSLLFIPYINENGLVRPMLDVGWTLTAEMGFYLLFKLSMIISHKHRAALTSFVLFAIDSICFLLFKNNAFYLQYNKSILYLAIGVILFCLWKRVSNKSEKTRLKENYLWILEYGTLWLGCVLFSFIEERGFRFLTVIIPIILFCLFLFGDARHPKENFVILLGNISFSTYLVHEFVVKGFSRLIYPLEEFNGLTLILSIGCTAVVVGIAYVVQTYFVNICERKL